MTHEQPFTAMPRVVRSVLLVANHACSVGAPPIIEITRAGGQAVCGACAGRWADEAVRAAGAVR